MSAEKFSPRVISPNQNSHNWHAIGKKEVLTELNTFESQGLKLEEVQTRLEQYGPNEQVVRDLNRLEKLNHPIDPVVEARFLVRAM